jgi:hypothetical protein
MGRPLNKKYFGNRNIGVNNGTLTDDNIGGEGIASVSFSNQGNFAADGTSTPLVGLSLPAPSIPTGVQATGTITYEVSTVTTGAGIGSLVVGAVYSYGTAPNFPECGNARWSVATTPGGGDATFTVTDRGTGIASIPTDTITVNMTKVSGSGPTNFTVDVWFRVKSFVIVEKGSGYTGDETITVTFGANASGTAVPVGTIVLTTDTGGQYAGDNTPDVKGKNVSTYQENAIVAIDVSDDSIVDIIKQEGARRFKVRTATTTKFLNLTYPGDTTGLFIQATDSDGYDYWVEKISGRKATVVGYSGPGTPKFDGLSVHWSFDDPDAASVKIRNA